MTEIKIVTERIQLRLIELSDLNSIHELHSLPETDQYNTLGIPGSIEETKLIVEPWIAENKLNKVTNYTFAIEGITDKTFIGLFGLKIGNEKYKRAEVWFKIHSKSYGKGYATETLKAIIDFGFETLNLHRIHAGCAVNNTASIRVLEKSGMIKEGRGRQVLPLKSGWSDNFEYSILETDNRK
jgi:ribosomal-protein-alanine N-acetyltransferase